MLELTDKYLDEWLDKLRHYWTTKDITGAMTLFNKCKHYQESPFRAPANELVEIETFWSEINDQDDISIKFNVLAICKLCATIEYEAIFLYKKSPYHSKGVYFIEFDASLNVVMFKQWFMHDSNET